MEIHEEICIFEKRLRGPLCLESGITNLPVDDVDLNWFLVLGLR